MPVLPLVASIPVWPGLSWPVFSASSMTPRARRSLTEPSGLKASTFTERLMPAGASLLILTTGVLPTVSRMLAYLCPTWLYLGSRSDAICRPHFGLVQDNSFVGSLSDVRRRHFFLSK